MTKLEKFWLDTPSAPLRVMSLWQPWATLCVARDPDGKVAKEIETRAWKPKIATPFNVVIHATKGFNSEQRVFCAETLTRRALNARGYYSVDPKRAYGGMLKPMPLGALIGVATVKEVIPADDAALRFAVTEEEKFFGLYYADRFAWLLGNQVEFQSPLQFKGKQQPLYTLPDELEASVDYQLGLTLAASPPLGQNSRN